MKRVSIWSIAIAVIALTLITSLAAKATDVQLEWVRDYDGPAHLWDQGHGVAADGAGNVYVTGWNKYDLSRSSLWLRKYNTNGDTLWTRTTGTYLSGTDVAVDQAGYVFVTGCSISLANIRNTWLRKYDTDGNTLWTRTRPGRLHGVALDTTGNIYVCGSEYRESQSNNIYLGKYDGDGNLIWSQTYDSPGHDSDVSSGVAVDGAGNVYITGSERRDDLGQSYNIWLRKYDTEGNTLWTQTYNSPANSRDAGLDVAVDTTGNVYVIGMEDRPDLGQWYNIWLRKYDTTGSPLWTDTYNHPFNHREEGYAVALDEVGNAYVTGYISPDNGSSYDLWLRKYSTNGSVVWTETYDDGGGYGEVGYDVTVDGSGNVYVAGHKSGNWEDIVLLKYSQTGEPPPPTPSISASQTAASSFAWRSGGYGVDHPWSTSTISEIFQPDNPKGNFGCQGTVQSNLPSGFVSAPTVPWRGVASRLQWGTPAQYPDVTSLIPVLSTFETMADYIEHLGYEPLPEDVRTREAEVWENYTFRIDVTDGTEEADMALGLFAHGEVRGWAKYRETLVRKAAMDAAIAWIPVGGEGWEHVGKLLLKNIGVLVGEQINTNLGDILGVAFDSRYKASLDWQVVIGEYGEYGVLEGNMGFGLWQEVPNAYPIGSETEALGGRLFTVPTNMDIPVSVMVGSFAQTAGYAAAEARVDKFWLELALPSHPDVSPLVLGDQNRAEWESDPLNVGYSYPGDQGQVAMRSNFGYTWDVGDVRETTLDDLNLGDFWVPLPGGTVVVLLKPQSPAGTVIPVILPESGELTVLFDILCDRLPTAEDDFYLSMILIDEDGTQEFAGLSPADILLLDFTEIGENDEGFAFHSGLIELSVLVDGFNHTDAFLMIGTEKDSGSNLNAGVAICGMMLPEGNFNVIPEPSTLLLLAPALFSFAVMLRRKSRRTVEPWCRG